MRAVARDLYLAFGIFAALTAIFVVRDGAPAGRMRAFLLLNISHYNSPFLCKSLRGTQESRREGFGTILAPLLGSLLTLDAECCPWHHCEALGADRQFALQTRSEAALLYPAQRVFHVTQQVGLTVYVSNRQVSLRRILNLIHLVRALFNYDAVPPPQYVNQIGFFSFRISWNPFISLCPVFMVIILAVTARGSYNARGGP